MADQQGSPSVVDNTPGGLVMPPWLLLLDDPDPRRVLVIGEADAAHLAWFADRGALVERLPADRLGAELSTTEGPEMGADLILVGNGVTKEMAGARGLRWLRGLGPNAAAVVPWRLTGKLQHRLGEAGFGCVRSVDADASSRPWRSPTAFGVVVLPHGPHARPPTWLVRSVRSIVDDAPATSLDWSLGAPGRYPSQKAVVKLRDRASGALVAVVKVTRHPRFNDRLCNEGEMLHHLNGLGGTIGSRVPGRASVLPVGSVVALAQEAVPGGPLIERSSFSPSCRLIEDARSTVEELGRVTAHRVPGSALVDQLWDAHTALVGSGRLPNDVADFLAQQVQVIAEETEVPAVLWHGDLGCWNLFEREGEVFLLDWESARLCGPPLWDLFYLARSFAIRSGRRHGLTRRRAVERHLLGTSRLNGVLASWVRSATLDLSLEPHLVEPLFHTCWMHRAAREGARLTPDQPGHYGPLCTLLVQRRTSPGVRRLVLDAPARLAREVAR